MAYWHDNIQTTLLSLSRTSIYLKQCHLPYFTTPSVCLSLEEGFSVTGFKKKSTQQEISVGWVSGKSEEGFLMTRNKKNKSTRCQRKWGTRVWDDVRQNTCVCINLVMKTEIVAEQSRAERINLDVWIILEVKLRLIFMAGDAKSHRVRQFAQMVAILGQHSNKKRNERLPLCPALSLFQLMQPQIKGGDVKVFK